MSDDIWEDELVEKYNGILDRVIEFAFANKIITKEESDLSKDFLRKYFVTNETLHGRYKNGVVYAQNKISEMIMKLAIEKFVDGFTENAERLKNLANNVKNLDLKG